MFIVKTVKKRHTISYIVSIYSYVVAAEFKPTIFDAIIIMSRIVNIYNTQYNKYKSNALRIMYLSQSRAFLQR